MRCVCDSVHKYSSGFLQERLVFNRVCRSVIVGHCIRMMIDMDVLTVAVKFNSHTFLSCCKHLNLFSRDNQMHSRVMQRVKNTIPLRPCFETLMHFLIMTLTEYKKHRVVTVWTAEQHQYSVYLTTLYILVSGCVRPLTLYLQQSCCSYDQAGFTGWV